MANRGLSTVEVMEKKKPKGIGKRKGEGGADKEAGDRRDGDKEKPQRQRQLLCRSMEAEAEAEAKGIFFSFLFFVFFFSSFPFWVFGYTLSYTKNDSLLFIYTQKKNDDIKSRPFDYWALLFIGAATLYLILNQRLDLHMLLSFATDAFVGWVGGWGCLLKLPDPTR